MCDPAPAEKLHGSLRGGLAHHDELDGPGHPGPRRPRPAPTAHNRPLTGHRSHPTRDNDPIVAWLGVHPLSTPRVGFGGCPPFGVGSPGPGRARPSRHGPS